MNSYSKCCYTRACLSPILLVLLLTAMPILQAQPANGWASPPALPAAPMQPTQPGTTQGWGAPPAAGIWGRSSVTIYPDPSAPLYPPPSGYPPQQPVAAASSFATVSSSGHQQSQMPVTAQATPFSTTSNVPSEVAPPAYDGAWSASDEKR